MKTRRLILVPLLLAASTLAAQQGPGPRPPHAQPPQSPGQSEKGDKGKFMPPPAGHLPHLVAALDADRDRVISREEISKAPAALRKLDRNKDDELTVAEFGVPRHLPPRDGPGKGDRKGPPPPRGEADGEQPDGPPPPPRENEGEDGPRPPQGEPKGPPPVDKRPLLPPPPLVAALDANRDGRISADEIKNSPDSLRKLDKNDDGQLSPEELAPKRPHPPKEDEPGVPPVPGADNQFRN